MAIASQKRALRAYRRRLKERGLARFEVLGLDADRELIKSVARRLVDDDEEARRIRSEMSRAIATSNESKGGILEALRRSPLVGADLDVGRARTPGRKVDL